MKWLVSSDWHDDHVTLGVPRKAEIERAVETTVEVAIKEQCDFYVFTGDLCDPDAGLGIFGYVEFAMRTALRLAEAEIASYWIAGNHDVIENGSGETTLTPFRAFDVLHHTRWIHLFEKPGIVRLDEGLAVAFLPFTATSYAYDPALIIEGAPADIPLLVFAHLTVPGVVPGEETIDMPRGRDVFLPLEAIAKRIPPTMVYNGHYHRRQDFKSPLGPTVHIPGSLARLNFGEQRHIPSFLIGEYA